MKEKPESRSIASDTKGASLADSLIDEQPWCPQPVSAEDFAVDGGWVNINRSPYDRVAGVLYKRAMAVKSVCHDPLDASPDLSVLWRGNGKTVVRWLFSEAPGTEEGLLQRREFCSLQTLTLAVGAATGERHHPGQDTILCVLSGRGVLHHREERGAPVIQRPLREGDLALISGDTRYSIGNISGPMAENVTSDAACAESDVGGLLDILVLHLGESDMPGTERQDG